MKKYSYIKSLWMSFYSKDLYIDIKNNWKGIGALYIASLTLIFTIIVTSTIFFVTNFNTEEKAERLTQILFEDANLPFEDNLNRILKLISSIPKMELKDNKLNIHTDSLTFLRDDYSKRSFVIFDPNGEIKTIKSSDAVVAFTPNYIIQKHNRHEESIIYFKELNNYNIKNYHKIQDFFNSISWILSQIPDLQIVNGHLKSSLKKPHFITYEYDKTDNLLAIIDPTSTYSYLDDQDQMPLLLVTENKLYLRNIFDKKDITEIYLSDLDINVMFNAIKSIIKITKKMLLTLTCLAFIILFLFTMLSTLFFALITSLIGLIIISYNKFEPLKFSTLFRISCVSITPVLLLNFILPMVFLSQKILYLLIATIYIYYAIKACDNENSLDRNRNV